MTTERRISGLGTACWTQQFTSVEEMSNPILHPGMEEMFNPILQSSRSRTKI
jgi:hypothetical protein